MKLYAENIFGDTLSTVNSSVVDYSEKIERLMTRIVVIATDYSRYALSEAYDIYDEYDEDELKEFKAAREIIEQYEYAVVTYNSSINFIKEVLPDNFDALDRSAYHIWIDELSQDHSKALAYLSSINDSFRMFCKSIRKQEQDRTYGNFMTSKTINYNYELLGELDEAVTEEPSLECYIKVCDALRNQYPVIKNFYKSNDHYAEILDSDHIKTYEFRVINGDSNKGGRAILKSDDQSEQLYIFDKSDTLVFIEILSTEPFAQHYYIRDDKIVLKLEQGSDKDYLSKDKDYPLTEFDYNKLMEEQKLISRAYLDLNRVVLSYAEDGLVEEALDEVVNICIHAQINSTSLEDDVMQLEGFARTVSRELYLKNSSLVMDSTMNNDCFMIYGYDLIDYIESNYGLRVNFYLMENTMCDDKLYMHYYKPIGNYYFNTTKDLYTYRITSDGYVVEGVAVSNDGEFTIPFKGIVDRIDQSGDKLKVKSFEFEGLTEYGC
jgi:hypothetical protein